MELDWGDVKQFYFNDDGIMAFLLNPMGKCMPLAQGIERLHIMYYPCMRWRAGRRFSLATNASFVPFMFF